jgi:hypothetical protein
MSKKKVDGGFLPFDLDNLEPDPAVSALVSAGQAAQAERKLPPKERQKKARKREKDSERSKTVYDLPKDILEKIAKIAAWNSTTASGIAALALKRFIVDVESGHVRVRDYLVPSESPRYQFRVNLDD